MVPLWLLEPKTKLDSIIIKKLNSFAQENAIRGKASRLRLCKWRVPKYYVKKRILRHGNKVNEIKYFNILTHHDICKTIIKNNEKLFSIMSNLQTHYHFKLDFQKVDPTKRKQMVNPRHQTPRGHSIANHGTPLLNTVREMTNILFMPQCFNLPRMTSGALLQCLIV